MVLKDKNQFKNKHNNLYTFVIVLVLVYLCLFKTDYKDNPKDIPFLCIGIMLILLPLAHYIVQKIQLYLFKKRFNNDEYVICETIVNYPKWILYIIVPAFLGICLGCLTTIILHPEVHYRRLNSENIGYAIAIVIALLYFFYHFILRLKTVLTNYGLRSNYKYDTLFEDVEKIEEENVGSINFLKIYKHHNSQANKIPKIYKPSNDRIDNITGSIMQDYEETKIIILETYKIYNTRRKNDC